MNLEKDHAEERSRATTEESFMIRSGCHANYPCAISDHERGYEILVTMYHLAQGAVRS